MRQVAARQHRIGHRFARGRRSWRWGQCPGHCGYVSGRQNRRGRIGSRRSGDWFRYGRVNPAIPARVHRRDKAGFDDGRIDRLVEERLVGHAGSEAGRAASGRRQGAFVAEPRMSPIAEAGVPLQPSSRQPAARSSMSTAPSRSSTLEHPVVGGPHPSGPKPHIHRGADLPRRGVDPRPGGRTP